jgi:hypothetical protein
LGARDILHNVSYFYPTREDGLLIKVWGKKRNPAIMPGFKKGGEDEHAFDPG